MRMIYFLIISLGLAMTACDNDSVNGLLPEPVVITPAELCIDLAQGNSATFTTNEPSYFMGVYLLGENLEFNPEEILGWIDESGAIFVWSCKGKRNSIPFEIGSDWYTLRQVDETTYEVTIGDVDEDRLITLALGSRVKGREPAYLDIVIKPKE